MTPLYVKWTTLYVDFTPLYVEWAPLYVRKSISELQIQVASCVFELSAGNCHR